MTTDIQKYDPKKEILLRDDVVLTKAEIKKHYAPGATDDSEEGTSGVRYDGQRSQARPSKKGDTLC